MNTWRAPAWPLAAEVSKLANVPPNIGHMCTPTKSLPGSTTSAPNTAVLSLFSVLLMRRCDWPISVTADFAFSGGSFGSGGFAAANLQKLALRLKPRGTRSASGRHAEAITFHDGAAAAINIAAFGSTGTLRKVWLRMLSLPANSTSANGSLPTACVLGVMAVRMALRLSSHVGRAMMANCLSTRSTQRAKQNPASTVALGNGWPATGAKCRRFSEVSLCEWPHAGRGFGRRALATGFAPGL